MTRFSNNTPAEIDAAWNEATVALRTAVQRLSSSVVSDVERRSASRRDGFKAERLTLSIDDLLARHDEQYEVAKAYEAAFDAYRASDYDEALRPERPVLPHTRYGETRNVLGAYHENAEQIREAREIIAEANEEFRARGGWERAFLVVSSKNGHVHRNWCSSWRWSTAVAIVTDLSGKDEAAIVEYAGEQACTKCFKSAPVATPDL